jgi:hypothetical protein
MWFPYRCLEPSNAYVDPFCPPWFVWRWRTCPWCGMVLVGFN